MLYPDVRREISPYFMDDEARAIADAYVTALIPSRPNGAVVDARYDVSRGDHVLASRAS